MDLIKKYLKAIAAFLGVWALNAVSDLTSGATAWPTSTQEWVRYVVTSLGGAILVALVPNAQDRGQVAKSLAKLPPEDKSAVLEGYGRHSSP